MLFFTKMHSSSPKLTKHKQKLEYDLPSNTYSPPYVKQFESEKLLKII